MKNLFLLLLMSMSLFLQSCTKQVSPASDITNSTDLQNSGARQASVSAPSITTVTSDAASSCVNCTPANLKNLLINWYTNPSTINITGTGFGSATLSVTDYATGKPITGYGFGITSVTDTKIQIGIGANPETALPITMVFKVVNAAGQSASWTVNSLPLSNGKVYGTFAYFVNRQRFLINKWPLPVVPTFTNSQNLDGNYIPQAGDALFTWTPSSSSLQAYINSVTQSPVVVTSSTKTQKTESYSYTYNLSEWVNNAEKKGVFIQYITKTTRYNSNGTVAGTSLSYTPYTTPQKVSVSKYIR